MPAAASGSPFAFAAMPAARFSSSKPETSVVTTNAEMRSRAAAASKPSKKACAPPTTKTMPAARRATAASDDTDGGEGTAGMPVGNGPGARRVDARRRSGDRRQH